VLGTQLIGPTGLRLMFAAYGKMSVPLWPSAALAIAPPANEANRIAANTPAAATDHRSRPKRRSVSRHWLRVGVATGPETVTVAASATPPIVLRGY